MKDEDKTFEAYFSGKMNSAKANDFSTALENNTELKERYDFFLVTKEAARLIERDKMRAELAGVEVKGIENVEDSLPEVRGPMLRIVKWSASIAAVLLISFFAYKNLQPPSPENLFAQNFDNYKVQAARGGDMDALKTIYTEGSYENFIDEALTKEESPELNMMIANAYINTDRFDEAIKTLTKISDDSSLRDQKYWYLGLILLKTGNSQEAISKFEKLQSISNYKKEESEEILSTISKL